jgi:wyosine [tRNA(Phe)-imidazoG37] synthetase (radical SAM superfamily)
MGGSGWSVEGMKKFNEIAKQVKMDRIRNGEDFNMQYNAFVEEEQNEKQTKKRKRIEINTYNDLNGSDTLHHTDDDVFQKDGGIFDTNDLLPTAV